jgi:phosphatidylglycerophosphatase C
MTTSPRGRPVLAVFDFDGTLTTADSLGAFLHRQLGTWGWCQTLVRQSPVLAGYVLRLLPNHQAKAALVRQALRGWPMQSLRDTAQALTQDWLPSHLDPWAMARLQAHQSQGHTCVLLSASLDVYLTPIAQHLHIDHLICTGLGEHEGQCTGELSTPNCHGEEKWRRLQAWWAAHNSSREAWELHAYGDTNGDLPVLREADRAWMKGQPWRPASA